MPSASPSSWDRRRVVRLATIALLAAMVFPAAAVGPEWFNALVPPSAQFHALVALLRWVQSGYIAVLAILPAALVVLTAALIRARGDADGRLAAWPSASRWRSGWPSPRRAPRRGWPGRAVPMPRLRTSFPDPPGERTVDIVVLGESSACGVPYHGLALGRPDRRLEAPGGDARPAVPGRRYLAQPGLKLDQVHQLMRKPGTPAGPGDPLRRAQRIPDAATTGDTAPCTTPMRRPRRG